MSAHYSTIVVATRVGRRRRCNKGGEKEENEEEEDEEEEELAEDDQGELLFAKAVFFENVSCVGTIVSAL